MKFPSGFRSSAILGAAFLMATSAIGPGFLTQTTVFTAKLTYSFGFVILVSVLLDIGAQLNIWRIVTVSGQRAPVLANALLPGAGHLLTVLIALGGLAFNTGNIAGCGLGLEVLTGLDTSTGAVVSCLLALGLFWSREAGKALDSFSTLLGFLMIGLTACVAVVSRPDLGLVVYRTFLPEQTDTTAIVTLVGGTVGGYITFAGAHRLLDAGVQGTAGLGQVTRSSVTGILLASVMRVLLFLAALGVVSRGFQPDPANPPASVFGQAAGAAGYRLFGLVMWSAAITSVVGSAYTSVSFLRSLHPWFERQQRGTLFGFVLLSTAIFLLVGKPVKVLILAGALNGLILPFSLGLMLVAVTRSRLVGSYRHPVWMQVAGWLVAGMMGVIGFKTLVVDMGKLW